MSDTNSIFDFGGNQSFTGDDFYISEDNSVKWTIDTSTTGDIEVAGDTDTNGDTWEIQDGSTSGSITIDTGQNITIGPNMEKIEEMKDIAREQLEKLQELQDTVIEYLSENSVTRHETEQAKSDVNKIGRMKRQLEGALHGDDFFISDYTTINEEDLLDRSQMEELNDIYRKWK